jgi:hypothetical protein
MFLVNGTLTEDVGYFFRVRGPFRSRIGSARRPVSGSFALQFFGRVLWEESRYRFFFIEQGAGFMGFCQYLSNEEGDVLARSDVREAYSVFDLIEVRNFKRC